ncbi:hypothetical protein GY14_07590 [Delftia tsuruhatensis]|nr:hypothetical protein GY14_07590 [Delftia tsuruhatensis]
MAVALGDEHQPVLGHLVRHGLEEGRLEVRGVAVFQIGAFVAAVEEGPVLGAHVGAMHCSKAHAGLVHLAPFLANLLALFLVQRGKKVVEVPVARTPGVLVAPVELHGAALHPAVGVAGCHILGIAEQQMQGRQLLRLGPFAHGAHQGRTQQRRACQQPAARHRRERHGEHALGVVIQPMLGVGARPGKVEHVLAIGMRLGVDRAGGDQLAALPERDHAGGPTGLRHGAAAGFQRAQVLVAHEGGGRSLRCQQRIPGLGIELLHAVQHAGDNCGFSHAIPCRPV